MCWGRNCLKVTKSTKKLHHIALLLEKDKMNILYYFYRVELLINILWNRKMLKRKECLEAEEFAHEAIGRSDSSTPCWLG